MANSMIVLKNGDAIEIQDTSSINEIKVLSMDRSTMLTTWEKMTPDNLSQVQIKNTDGLVAGTYTDLLLASETSVVREDGTVVTTYNLRKKTDVELLTERLKALEEGQQVHAGAIADLGDITGVLAEQMEGGTV